MEAKDLTSGNYILSHSTKKWVTVDWLVMKHMEGGNILGIHTPSIPVYEPIPLTQEVFKKNTGFVSDKKSHYFIELSATLVMEYDTKKGLSLSTAPPFKEVVSLKHIQFLHQLQNLYYLHTGKVLLVTHPDIK